MIIAAADDVVVVVVIDSLYTFFFCANISADEKISKTIFFGFDFQYCSWHQRACVRVPCDSTTQQMPPPPPPSPPPSPLQPPSSPLLIRWVCRRPTASECKMLNDYVSAAIGMNRFRVQPCGLCTAHDTPKRKNKNKIIIKHPLLGCCPLIVPCRVRRSRKKKFIDF